MLTLILVAPVGLQLSLAGTTLAVKVREACAQLGVDSTALTVPAALKACNEAMGIESRGTLLAQADELVTQLGLKFDETPPGASTRSPPPPPRRDPKLPRMVVFDLDFTLWHPELYQLSSGPPFTTSADGCAQLQSCRRRRLSPSRSKESADWSS